MDQQQIDNKLCLAEMNSNERGLTAVDAGEKTGKELVD